MSAVPSIVPEPAVVPVDVQNSVSYKAPLLLMNFVVFVCVRYVPLVQMISYCILFSPFFVCPYSRPFAVPPLYKANRISSAAHNAESNGRQ
jgi:hypothetical protein